MLFRPHPLDAADQGLGAILSIIGGGGPAQSLEVPDSTRDNAGAYTRIGHWNPEHEYRIVPPFDEGVNRWLATIEVPEYGVCDSVEQFHDLFGRRLEADILPWCVFFTHVPKRPGDEGGWRWHKWGQYVGGGTPTAEYLDDEPPGSFDDGVFTFHVYYPLLED